MSFLSTLFTGSNPTLGTDVGKLGDLGNFSSNVGQGDTTAASNYYNGILSGDPAKIAETLAPELSTNQQQTQQQKQTMAQFGSRSGGNTGAANAADTASRANVVNLIGGAQKGAAAADANLGENETSQASNDVSRQAQLSQEQLQNIFNSIFGQGIGAGFGSIEGHTLGVGGI